MAAPSSRDSGDESLTVDGATVVHWLVADPERSSVTVNAAGASDLQGNVIGSATAISRSRLGSMGRMAFVLLGYGCTLTDVAVAASSISLAVSFG